MEHVSFGYAWGKNQYEEELFKCEDAHFEVDMVIETNMATIRVLQPLVDEINEKEAQLAAERRAAKEAQERARAPPEMINGLSVPIMARSAGGEQGLSIGGQRVPMARGGFGSSAAARPARRAARVRPANTARTAPVAPRASALTARRGRSRRAGTPTTPRARSVRLASTETMLNFSELTSARRVHEDDTPPVPG